MKKFLVALTVGAVVLGFVGANDVSAAVANGGELRGVVCTPNGNHLYGFWDWLRETIEWALEIGYPIF